MTDTSPAVPGGDPHKQDNQDPQYTPTQMREALDAAYQWLSEARTERDDAREKVEQLREECAAYGDTLTKIAESRLDENVLNVSAAVIAKMTLNQRGYLPFGRLHVMTQAWQEAETQRDEAQEVARVALVALERAETDIKYVEAERDEARRDLAAATAALARIRELCDQAQRLTMLMDEDCDVLWRQWIREEIAAVLPAAGDGAGEATTE